MRLLPDFHGVGLVSGVQNAKPFSGDQDSGLALMRWKDSARGVGQNMVTRRGGAVGVMLGRHGQGWQTVLPGVQDAGLSSMGRGGFHQRCGPRCGNPMLFDYTVFLLFSRR